MKVLFYINIRQFGNKSWQEESGGVAEKKRILTAVDLTFAHFQSSLKNKQTKSLAFKLNPVKQYCEE